ncbi:MAG: ABC transporter permease subunit [Candidatus Latescibacteria bacterium]|nr:ABC transporter permease subunit [Candidatus Latescibacterota bacterium]
MLANLWREKKTRQLIIQIIAVIVVLTLLGSVVRNTLYNLEVIGRDVSYAFLFTPSNYDINQHLIEYDSRSTHLRATIVGVINTALVAFFGIILATLIGFTAGVARLSSNFLVNRISYLFVEFSRNVPVLLWILLCHGVIVHNLPHPRQAVSAYGMFFLTNRGVYSPKPIFDPAFWGVMAALIIAIGGAFYFYRFARQKQELTGQQYPVYWTNFSMVVALPLLAFWLLGFPLEFEIPAFKRFNFAGGLVLSPEFLALTLALGVYTGAFIAEIVRAGILAVSYGQTEASYALGIKPNFTMRLVILPQALRIIVPPLISQFLNLTKNSSLAIAVGYMDIVATIGGISLNQTGRALECMSIVLAIYLSISLSISAFMNWYNKRISLVER